MGKRRRPSDKSKGPSSWGDMLRSYRSEKVQADHLLEAVHSRPPARSHATIKREEREFDPLLGRFRDQSKEESKRQEETLRATRRANRGFDRSLRQQQRFDIVTHAARIDDDEPPPRKPPTHTFSTRAGVNIVTNEPLPEERARLQARETDAARKREARLATAPKRDFDVLTNRYAEKHEEKAAADREAALRSAAEKLWRQRAFDPLTQTWRDRGRDREEAEAEARIAREQRERRAHAAPVRVLDREGAAYDIVGHSVRDSERLKRCDGRERRPLVRPTRLAAEGRMRREEDARRAAEEQRALTRARPTERQGQAVGRMGYDPVTLRETRGPLFPGSRGGLFGGDGRGRAGDAFGAGAGSSSVRGGLGGGSQARAVRGARMGLGVTSARGAGEVAGGGTMAEKLAPDPSLRRGGAWARLAAVERGAAPVPRVVPPPDPRREAGAAARAHLESRGAGGGTAASYGLVLG